MHIDLFSGIGGFTLAGEWAGFRTVVFCEKERFCQKILKKHWPEVPIIEEIRNFDGTKWRGATLLTGGFPCQPFSVAGQRRGKKDDRYLWPEMLKVIDEAKPHWILAENVPGIFRMALDTVLADLESKGYATGTFIIPACGLNAPHRRNRIWIVAHSQNSNWRAVLSSENEGRRPMEIRRSIIHASDSSNFKGRTKQKIEPGGKARIEVGEHRRVSEREWNKNWLEVATRFCRMDDGVPDRVHRLKALGNTIVPQVAYEILKNIAWIEKELHGN